MKKTGFTTIVVIIAMFFNSVTNAQSNVEWKFVNVEKIPSCKSANNGPEACSYLISLLMQDETIFTSGFEYSEVKYILKYYDVKTPEELEGKTFKSHTTDVLIAINYLNTVQRHGGRYTPPTDKELYEQTALAMSKMDCPDFSDVDNETVYDAFYKAWKVSSFKKDWMRHLQKRISILSGGKVKLDKGDKAKFPLRNNRPDDEYLLLSNAEKSIMVTMGPYTTPVRFH